MTRFTAQLAGIDVISQDQRNVLGLSGKSLAARVTGSGIMDSYRSSALTGVVAKTLGDQVSGSRAIINSYRSSALTGVVAKTLGDQVSGSRAIMDSYRGIAASSGIMDSYRSSALTGVVAKTLGDQVSGSRAIMDSYRGIAASSGIMDSYRSTLGIVSKSFAAQLVATSGIDALHRNAAGITAHSLLFGERYRASTLGAVSQLVGPAATSELVDQVVGDNTLSGVGSSDAWLLIEEAAPELAAAIDEQAKQLGVVWVDQPAVRNTVAGIVVGLVVSLYVVGFLVPPPLNGILCLMLGAGGVSVPGATQRMDRWLDEQSPETPGDGAQ